MAPTTTALWYITMTPAKSNQMLTCTKLGNGTTKTHLHEESVAGKRFTEVKAILGIEDGNSAAANTTTVINTEHFVARSKDQPPSKVRRPL